MAQLNKDEAVQQKLAKANDPVNPNHYADLNKIGFSALHVTEVWRLGYHLGQTLKYMQRAGLKPGESELTDLKKAHWYLARYIHNLDPTFENPMPNDPFDENHPLRSIDGS